MLLRDNLFHLPNALFSLDRLRRRESTTIGGGVGFGDCAWVDQSSAPSAQAQTFNVLHNFTGGGDGASPGAGLTMDKGGNFYGTTESGGAGGPNGYGTVFKLTHKGSGWALTSVVQLCRRRGWG